jgi:hypothetical protein
MLKYKHLEASREIRQWLYLLVTAAAVLGTDNPVGKTIKAKGQNAQTWIRNKMKGNEGS